MFPMSFLLNCTCYRISLTSKKNMTHLQTKSISGNPRFSKNQKQYLIKIHVKKYLLMENTQLAGNGDTCLINGTDV